MLSEPAMRRGIDASTRMRYSRFAALAGIMIAEAAYLLYAGRRTGARRSTGAIKLQDRSSARSRC